MLPSRHQVQVIKWCVNAENEVNHLNSEVALQLPTTPLLWRSYGQTNGKQQMSHASPSRSRSDYNETHLHFKLLKFFTILE